MTAGAIKLNTAGYRCLTAAGNMILCCPVSCDGYPNSLTEYADDFSGDLSGWAVAGSNFATASGNVEVEKFGGTLLNYFKCNDAELDYLEIDIEADMQTADAPNSGDDFHDAFVGVYDTSFSQGRYIGIRIENRLNGATHEFRFVGVSGSTSTELVGWAAAPGSATARILIEWVPDVFPETWTIKYYIDGVEEWSTSRTDLETVINDFCEIAIGYVGSGENLIDILDPPAAGFISFRSTSFAATVSCGGDLFGDFFELVEELGG